LRICFENVDIGSLVQRVADVRRGRGGGRFKAVAALALDDWGCLVVKFGGNPIARRTRAPVFRGDFPLPGNGYERLPINPGPGGDEQCGWPFRLPGWP
jgi:hypothetical protein